MVPSIQFNSDVLIMIAGAVISMFFTYIPKFNTWFAVKTDEVKQLMMLGILFLITVVVFLLGCFNVLSVENFVCDKQTGWHFIYTFILAAMANQGADRIMPKPIAVRQAREIIKDDELYFKGKLSG